MSVSLSHQRRKLIGQNQRIVRDLEMAHAIRRPPSKSDLRAMLAEAAHNTETQQRKAEE